MTAELSAAKQALLALKEARAQWEALDRARNEPIAIVGMGCRFPGAGDPDAFWRLLRDGRDAITEVPAGRWDAAALYAPEPAAPGKSYARWGGFLADVAGFDAPFFGISPREAESMDPQQRLLLEVAYEALEDAGVPVERLAGTAAGVFIGANSSDYARLQAADLAAITTHTGTGSTPSILANRLSYVWDLQGPSVVVDTACSSALVAVHQAIASLRAGECAVALAGGVHLMLAPDGHVAMAKMNALSPTGRCRTFDASADGYVRAEGCGVVVLKRLSDALRDGDRPLALLRGSAVNQDGRSNGLTAPNGPAQQRLLRRALERSGVAPADVGYVEAHGTGTPLGDPIEVEAIAAVLGGPRPAGPCYLGAAKANVGHLEPAAGIVGLIKAVQVLRHATIPPQLHLDRLNPALRLEGTGLAIPRAATPWPAGAGPRVAGVSSFGIGGTNAHVVLEEAPVHEAAPAAGPYVLPLSAQDPRALAERAAAVRMALADGSLPLADACHTAARRLPRLAQRFAAVGDGLADVLAALAAPAAGAVAGASADPAARRLAEAWVGGEAVDWSELGLSGSHAALPPYPWQRLPLWFAPATGSPRAGHPFMEPAVAVAPREAAFAAAGTLAPAALPWLADHRVQGAIVVPGMAHLEAAFAAVGPGTALEDVAFEALLSLGADEARPIAVMADGAELALYSRLDGAWVKHMGARTRPAGPATAPAEPPEAWTAGAEPLDVAGLYRDLASHGIELGARFQGVRSLWRRGTELLARVALPETEDPAGYGVHPALLDACIQIAAEARPDGGAGLWLPAGVARAVLHRPGGRAAWSHMVLREADDRAFRVDVTLRDDEGAAIAELVGLRIRRAAGAAADDGLLALTWEAQTRLRAGDLEAEGKGAWLLVGDFPELARRLDAVGQPCVRAADQLAASGGCRGIVVLAGPDPLDGPLAALAALRAADEHGLAGRLYMVTAGLHRVGAIDLVPDPAMAPTWGFARSLALEHPERRPTAIDLSAQPRPEELDALARELRAGGLDDMVALRGQERYVARLARYVPADAPAATAAAAGRPFKLAAPEPGVIDRLALVEARRRAPAPGEVEVALVAAGLNFIDVLKALGLYPGLDPDAEPVLGAEAAGRVVRVGPGVEGLAPGDAVIVAGGPAIATHLTVDARLVVPKPAGLGFAEAAALPIAYLTAELALNELARVRPGEKVLIHAAAGGVGLAAVHLAHRAGAEVFATAGTPEKRELLRSLGVAHVFDSRSLSFVDGVREATGGAGVDVVLNSLAGDFIPAGLGLLRPRGRFLEIGKRDIYAGTPIGLDHFKRNVSYHAIDLVPLLTDDPGYVRALLTRILEGLADGSLAPLPVTPYPVAKVADAFTYMARGLHVGKLVLELEDADVAIQAQVPLVDPGGAYLVTGGLGALGLGLAERLAGWGARHLVLAGRRAPDPAAEAAIARLRAAGCAVTVRALDVAAADEVSGLIAAFGDGLPPLRGVFHAAGVLDDGLALTLAPERFERVFAAKARGAWHLHQATRELALDHFVLFSSAASLVGSPGQANYAAANAFLDGLAARRRAEGRPALSVNWGPWAEAGMAARTGGPAGGVLPIDPARGFATLRALMKGAPAQVGVLPLDWPAFARANARLAGSPLFSALAATTAAAPAAGGGAFAATLKAAPAGDRHALLLAHLREQTARVLRLAGDRIDVAQPLPALGLDSLMAVELRNRLERDLAIEVPAIVFLQGQSVTQLAHDLLGRLFADEAEAFDVDGLSDDDVDAMLAQLLAQGSQA